MLTACPTPSRRHLAALQRVFRFAFLASLERSAYNPTQLHQIALPPWFECDRQNDCHEFLSYLLDAICEENRNPASTSKRPAPPAVPPPPVRTVTTLRAKNNTNIPPGPGTAKVRRLGRSFIADADTVPTTSFQHVAEKWDSLLSLTGTRL